MTKQGRREVGTHERKGERGAIRGRDERWGLRRRKRVKH